jgi:hypothetical protein
MQGAAAVLEPPKVVEFQPSKGCNDKLMDLETRGTARQGWRKDLTVLLFPSFPWMRNGIN